MSEQQISYGRPQQPGYYKAPTAVEVNPRQLNEPAPQGVQRPMSAVTHFEDVYCPLTRQKCMHEDCAWFKSWVTNNGTFGMCAAIDISKTLFRLSANLDRLTAPKFG